MGSFTRSGTFGDRAKFVVALKKKLAKLQEGVLRGTTLRWESGSEATLTGFGARIAFQVGEKDWSCAAEVPGWIPVPQKAIEEKFDLEFESLKQL